MNLPNSLTVTRIFLVPLLVVVLLTQFEGRRILGVPKEFVGAAIFGIASITAPTFSASLWAGEITTIFFPGGRSDAPSQSLGRRLMHSSK